MDLKVSKDHQTNKLQSESTLFFANLTKATCMQNNQIIHYRKVITRQMK